MRSGHGRRTADARVLFTDNGYSLPELMLTAGIIAVISAVAVFQFSSAQQSVTGDGIMRVLLAQLNTAREQSIAQRRNMLLQFQGPNGLQIVRQDVPSGTTVIGLTLFESGAQYYLAPGLPDTPDAFGRSRAVDFGTATGVLFSTGGTLIDQAGRPVNGTIFVGLPGRPFTYRAITVLGATGRVRAYRWNGIKWVAS